MRWITGIFMGIVLGYAIGAAAGAALTAVLSTNNHDKTQEITMTAFFFTGPVGAVLGVFVMTVVMIFRKRPQARP